MPSRSELKKNLKALRTQLEGRPMDLDARMRIARTHRLLGDSNDAVAHYGAVARYLSLAGHPLQAIAVLRELLQVAPTHEETLLFLAKLYARTRAADVSNRGRVAVPILEGPVDASGAAAAGPALADGLPMTATGIWRAIRPESTNDLAVVKDADDVGAVIDDEDEDGIVDLDDDADIIEDAADVDVDADIDAPAGLAGNKGNGGAALTPFEESVLVAVPLFSSLDADAFLRLGQAMVLHQAKAGDVLFREGDAGDSCVVIARGEARVTRQVDGMTVELAHLQPGDMAGLFALVSAETRQATVTASTAMEVFEIDRLAIEAIMVAHPGARSALTEMVRERLVSNLLLDMPLCAGFTSEEADTFRERLGERDLLDGKELFSPFMDTDGLWLVLGGALHVGEEGKDGELEIHTTLKPGDWVASVAATVGTPTGLTVEADGDTTILVLPHVVLHPLLAQHGVDGLGIAQVLSAGVRAGTLRR